MDSREFSKQTFKIAFDVFFFPHIMKVKGGASYQAFNSFEKLTFSAFCEWVRLKGYLEGNVQVQHMK